MDETKKPTDKPAEKPVTKAEKPIVTEKPPVEKPTEASPKSEKPSTENEQLRPTLATTQAEIDSTPPEELPLPSKPLETAEKPVSKPEPKVEPEHKVSPMSAEEPVNERVAPPIVASEVVVSQATGPHGLTFGKKKPQPPTKHLPRRKTI